MLAGGRFKGNGEKEASGDEEQVQRRSTATERANTRIASYSGGKSGSKSDDKDCTATKHAEQRQKKLSNLNQKTWKQFRRLQKLYKTKHS